MKPTRARRLQAMKKIRASDRSKQQTKCISVYHDIQTENGISGVQQKKKYSKQKLIPGEQRQRLAVHLTFIL